MEVVKQAADDAAIQGISAKVIDLRTLVPLDMGTLRASTGEKRAGWWCWMENLLCRQLCNRGIDLMTEDPDIFFSLKAPVARVCGPDTPYPVQWRKEEGHLINRLSRRSKPLCEPLRLELWHDLNSKCRMWARVWPMLK
ncbi:MAG: transketolase C-terminal domain-containing protein [Anaerolineae bacterium]